VLRNWLPPTLISPTDAELEVGGLYQLIRGTGTYMRIARQRIGARGASTHEARLLGGRKNDGVLTMQRTAYADSGRASRL
jgi:DNA-binding GntR family transcriptional regulator